MINELNRLAADKCEVWMHRTSYTWHVHISTEREGVKVEVKENDSKEDVETVFFRALAKFDKLTAVAPELLPPRLAPPTGNAPEYTEFKELKPSGVTYLDEIPF